MARASKSPEQFAAEMAQANPGIELAGAYVNARTKVACRCRACGATWDALPNHLLRGVGCPACAGRTRLTPDEFAARVAQASPDVELTSTYESARTPVACRCRVCGHEWETQARNLLAGCGCPACAHRRSAANLRAGE